jgi:N-acetylmuramoyl-L-alanine amidase
MFPFLILLGGCGLFFGVGGAVEAVRANTTVPFAPRIIIDAGHGGFDGGAVGIDGTVEKDINLAVSRKLRQLAELYGFEVVMIRDQDISVDDDGTAGIRNRKVSDLNNRLKLARQHPGAIYLSIHQNKFPQSKPWGAQIFYGQKNEQSLLLAEKLQSNLIALLQPENKRAVKPAEKNLYLIYNIESPAVLIECGFLSNPAECARLQEPEYQQQLAFVILRSTIEFLQSSGQEGAI